MLDHAKKLALFLIWIYIIIRAYSVPITHDEAYSFLLVKTNYIKAMAGTANTHWLNSLGMKLGNIFLGDAPWQLRIFSVLAWTLYGFSAYKLSQSTGHKVLGLALFVMLTFNPFVLDFFSLARGYGLTCAFVLASLWKLNDLFNDNNLPAKHWRASLLFAMAALFSNYTALFFLMAVSAGFLVFCVIEKKLKIIQQPQYRAWYLLVLSAGAFAVGNLLFIKFYTGDLEYGGHSNLVGSLLGSLVRGSFYFHGNEMAVTLVSQGLAYLLLACFLYVLYFFRKQYLKMLPFVTAVLFFVVVLIAGFHIFFGTPFLYSRTTLMLYPLLITLVFSFLNDVQIRFPKAILVITIPVTISMIGMVAHFATCVNDKYSFEWKQQSESRECFDFLVAARAKQVLIHEWHFGVYKNYYSFILPQTYGFASENLRTADCLSVTEDFYAKAQRSDFLILLPPFNLQRMYNKGLNFEVVKTFPFTGSVIIKMMGND